MPEIRCENCGKKLAEGVVRDGELNIQCPKCRTIQTIKPATTIQVQPHPSDGFIFSINKIS